MPICFITYGCKVNQAEAQKWELVLRSYGYEITDSIERADIWIINTCAVTHKAENQSRKIINKAKEFGVKAIVTGCYVTLKNLKTKEEKLIFLSNSEKDKVIHEFKPLFKSYKLNLSRHRAIVKIQDGCDHFCSYCVVPYLRGRPKSIPKEQIIDEIENYHQIGIKEVILSGINLGLYGKDFKELNLKVLLKEILKNTQIPKIRLSSLEVNHIDDEFLEILGERRICKHLHIPLQHGSNRILQLMNRRYNIKSFEEKIKKIVKLYPKISIGTDIIVGFPSETNEDFQEMTNVIKALNFSYLHVFPYSNRPNTYSSRIKDQVSEDIKKDRTEILMQIAKELKEQYMKQFIGQNIEVIIESKKSGFYTGTSDNYIKCVIEENNLVSKDLIEIKVTKIRDHFAYGKILKN